MHDIVHVSVATCTCMCSHACQWSWVVNQVCWEELRCRVYTLSNDYHYHAQGGAPALRARVYNVLWGSACAICSRVSIEDHISMTHPFGRLWPH